MISQDIEENIQVEETLQTATKQQKCHCGVISNVVWIVVAITCVLVYVLILRKADNIPRSKADNIPRSMAKFAFNAMKLKKGTEFEFKLNPHFDVSNEVLKLSKDNFSWKKHRQFCRNKAEKNSLESYQVVENKMLTSEMFESQQFINFAKEKYNADVQELTKLLPKRVYELQIKSDEKIDWDQKKFEFLHPKGGCTRIIFSTDYNFVYKAVHLSANAGVNFMNKNKWTEENWSCEKLWNKLEKIVKEETIGNNFAVARNQETGDGLNPGVIIEKTFPKFPGCTDTFEVAEIKLVTIFGRVILSWDACNFYKPIYRFRDGSYAVYNMEMTDTYYNIQKSLDVHWEKIIKWTEIIANYVGSDRLRVDWFHNNDQLQFNELAYPGAGEYPGWNQMLADVIYDGYKHNIYGMRNSSELIGEQED